ncbi:MAG TPA: VOC family protein [Jatrophihabitantaceae bacterium]|jgi:predicted enzyme related to lactoylglutathione lyase
MTSGVKTIIYPVKDLAAAKALFSKALGAEPVMDEAYYVQYNVGGQEIGLDPNGYDKGLSGPAVYWQVDDIKQSVEALLADGAQTHQELTDFGSGGKRLVASVKDADGNVVGFIQEN